MELVKMKKENPEQYKQFLKDAEDVSTDLFEMLNRVITKTMNEPKT